MSTGRVGGVAVRGQRQQEGVELCRSRSLSHWVSVFHSLSKSLGAGGGKSREAASCSARSGSDSRETNSGEKEKKKKKKEKTNPHQPTNPPTLHAEAGTGRSLPTPQHAASREEGKKSTLPGQERS